MLDKTEIGYFRLLGPNTARTNQIFQLAMGFRKRCREKVIQDSPYLFAGLASDTVRSFMKKAPTPQWIIECRHCAVRFVHSEVGKDRSIFDYLRPTEPTFSSHGEELECPNCGTRAVYIVQDLRYQFR